MAGGERGDPTARDDRAGSTAASDRRVPTSVALGLLPWSVVLLRDDLTLVVSVGLVSPGPIHLTDIASFFVHTRGLPRFLAAWPVGAALYGVALGSAVAGRVLGREDRRLTAGPFGLVGLGQLLLAPGLSRRAGTVALPVGTLLVWGAVRWFEWPALVGARPVTRGGD